MNSFVFFFSQMSSFYLISNGDDKCDKIILLGVERSFLC